MGTGVQSYDEVGKVFSLRSSGKVELELSGMCHVQEAS